MSVRRSALRALAVAGALTATLSAGATAQAAPAPAHAATPTVATAWGSGELPINPQAQQNSNWCWAATGTTIANYMGKSVNQNTFCNLAFQRNTNTSCPNSQATLANDQVAFRALGIKPGVYATGYLNYDGVADEIAGNRPILTRIEWSSGGGHMMVINGFNADEDTVEWYNPWPSDQRINVGYYDYYVDNGDFSWTHTLYGIGAR